MYTQCPDCSTAFRITAEVLKQAAGKVRCGGCGNAFNALDYLSEQRPASAAAAASQGAGGRRVSKAPGLEAAQAPRTITPERSSALLRTLDELAGSDRVRIEDTGVEWRVVDESEVDNDAGANSGPVRSIEDTGSMRFVIAENDGGSSAEMRFDDNTPLPEDFDFDEEPAAAPPPEPVEEAPDVDQAQADLALGDPEEWQDLLGEVQGPPEGIGERRDRAAESDSQHALSEELVAAVADDSPSSIDEQFAMQAEAMGIDISGAYQKAVAEQSAAAPRDVGDRSIDDDLIAAAFETEERLRQEREATQVGTAGIDDQSDDEADEEDSVEIILEAGDDEALDLELDASSTDIEALDIELDDSGTHEALDMELDDSGNYEALDMELDDSASHEALDMELVEEDIEAMEAVFDAAPGGDAEPAVPLLSEEELTINKMIDEELLAIAVEDEDGFASTIVQIQPIETIKPPDAARKKGRKADVEAQSEDSDDDSDEEEDEHDVFGDNPLVETIIMEGDSVRDEAEQRALDKRRRKQAKEREIEEKRRAEAKVAEEKAAEEARQRAVQRARNFRLVAGIVALALLLALQVLHFSRETLAANPAIQNLIAPFYRLFGQDILPAYDVRGWRFEATRGSVSDSDNTLTIYSRIGNGSAKTMPYPLISVSLTDRFEDSIGGVVVDSSEYLGAHADTLAQVAPQQSFDAMITIEAPDAEAVGFKLNVCYDSPGKRLRCAMEDFR